MNLPTVDSLDLKDKKVLLRADLDFDDASKRLEVLVAAVKKLLSREIAKIIILGHKGRPEGKRNEEDSLHSLISILSEKIGEEAAFMPDFESSTPENKVVVFENLRFWLGEERNDAEFTEKLAALGDVYINESFATSHRDHSSIVGLAKKLPHAAGEHFIKEVMQISKLLESPEKPFITFLSGVKEDKVSYLDKLIEISDKVLVSGRLPEYLGEDYKHEKVVLARLIQDKEDITLHSAEAFEREISHAKTILVSGPMGKFEEEGHRLGTKRVFNAISESSAYKIAGGGDTEAAISLLGLEGKFDWISTGGGAMLEFIVKGTLPGITALNE